MNISVVIGLMISKLICVKLYYLVNGARFALHRPPMASDTRPIRFYHWVIRCRKLF